MRNKLFTGILNNDEIKIDSEGRIVHNEHNIILEYLYSIVSKDTIYYNSELFRKTKNILFVTGLSGSGKTTISFIMADKLANTVVLELDYLLHMFTGQYQYMHRIEEVNQYGYEIMEKYGKNIKNKIDNADNAEIDKAFEKFINWFIKNYSDDKHNFIIEGIYIYRLDYIKTLKKYPIMVIMKSTIESAWKSYLSKRERRMDINLFIEYISPSYVKWYAKETKVFKEFVKKLQKLS